MSTFRERREAKAERLREWADKREAKGKTDLERAEEISSVIPMGQPVLTGHHSEGRHRRDLDRIQSATKRGVENLGKADEFRARADSIERAAGRAVYSDDPDAVERLTVRLVEAECRLAWMKVANGVARVGGDWRAGLKANLIVEGEQNFRFWPGGTDIPFPNVRNVSAQVRRDRKRLAELKEADSD